MSKTALNPNIRFFNECSLLDVALVGGKGANLGELTRAGFPVPEGFAVTAEAYRTFIEVNRLSSPIRKIVAGIHFDDHAEVGRETERIRSILAAASIPQFLVEDIQRAYGGLGDESLVAVRSSSAIPSLAVSSSPGMMDTFYNISGLDQLLHYVKLCWTSVWTARAAANRWNKGIDHFSVRVAALVQKMVPSQYSGVAFTINPVNWTSELVVEAIAGLGEALVSGKVTPETFVLEKNSLSTSSAPVKAAVPKDIIVQVGSAARDIEKHYGRAQDIEWAWADGKLYILQSRDIKKAGELTTDYAGLERWNKPAEKDEDEIIWTRAWSDEVLTRAITPLFYSVQADLITETYDFMYRSSGMQQLLPLKLMRFHKNRGYFSTRYLMECLRYAPKFARGADALKFFTPQQREQAKTMSFRVLAKLRSEFYLSQHFKQYTLTRCYKTFYDEWLPQLLKRVRELDGLDLEPASLEQLSQYYWGMDRLIKDHCKPIGFGVMVHTFAMVTFLGTVLEKWLGNSRDASVLLSGLPGNSTVALNEDLWKLSRRIVANSELCSIFAGYPADQVLAQLNKSSVGTEIAVEIETFRKTYDFRGAEDREISCARWGDNPSLLINVLKLLVAAPDQSDPEAAFRRNAERREELTAGIETQLSRQPWGPLKRRIFRFLLKYAQIYSLFRENQRFEVDRVFYGQRKAFVAIGHKLEEKGLLADSEDIWFLSKEEVFDLVQAKMTADQAQPLITARRAEYRKYLRLSPPMFLQGAREFEVDDERPSVSVTTQEGTLRGVPASAGQATGTARVVHNLNELVRVQPGDILITNSTDPGWTPVFLLIKGLVLETGGILAHGTVLSREYGIPAVTSVLGATDAIKDGDVITIDGSQGCITLHTAARTQRVIS